MGDRRAVVIGAGITGVLAARELALAGWEVVVLEAEHVGAGSSSRSAAGIRQQFSTPSTVRAMRYAVRAYRRFAEETEGGVSPIVQNGYLFLHTAQTWAQAVARVGVQRSAGLTEVEALEGEALFARFPWVARDAVVGGTFCPTDGFLLPHVIYQEGARRVAQLGGRVVQRAPVVGGQVRGGRLVGVDTPKGRFEADVFLDCTNAWTGRLARVLGASPLPVDPVKRYLWFLARDGGMTASTLAAMPLVVCTTGLYCRPENDGTLMMGKAHAGTPEPDFEDADQDRIAPDYSHKGGVDAVPFGLWMELAAEIPQVGEFAGMQATTSGYYAITPDHNPFLSHDPALPGLIRLVGFSGHGAMMGPFTARVALALAEAGRDLASVQVDGEEVELGAFAIGRVFGETEAMVI